MNTEEFKRKLEERNELNFNIHQAFFPENDYLENYVVDRNDTEYLLDKIAVMDLVEPFIDELTKSYDGVMEKDTHTFLWCVLRSTPEEICRAALKVKGE